MALLLPIRESVIGDERFTFPFLCSDQLCQQIILGHNFAIAFHIGTWWNQRWQYLPDKTWQTIWVEILSSTINALVFCTESIVIPPDWNGCIQWKVPKVKLKASLGKNCVFEPSYKHRSNYVNCTTYEGIVTLDDSFVSSGTFNIVMASRSNKHIKVIKGHTMGMLKPVRKISFAPSIGLLPLNKSLWKKKRSDLNFKR